MQVNRGEAREGIREEGCNYNEIKEGGRDDKERPGQEVG